MGGPSGVYFPGAGDAGPGKGSTGAWGDRMRIGIWCEFGGQTLSPFEGIGVFVANLVTGLVRQPGRVEVVLLVHPDDPEVMAPLCRLAPARVSLLPDPGQLPDGPPLQRLLARWLRLSE